MSRRRDRQGCTERARARKREMVRPTERVQQTDGGGGREMAGPTREIDRQMGGETDRQMKHEKTL